MLLLHLNRTESMFPLQRPPFRLCGAVTSEVPGIEELLALPVFMLRDSLPWEKVTQFPGPDAGWAAEDRGDLELRRTCQIMNKKRYPQAASASLFGCLNPIRKQPRERKE